MGSLPTKIKDTEKIKIYRRVSLQKAQDQYRLLSLNKKKCMEKHTYPISVNFCVFFQTGDSILYIQHFEDDTKRAADYSYLEIETPKQKQDLLLYKLLSYQLVYLSNRSKENQDSTYFDSFKMGLNKHQYEWLFL
jgi:hypothetical protein